jgi:hypothetical protein
MMLRTLSERTTVGSKGVSRYWQHMAFNSEPQATDPRPFECTSGQMIDLCPFSQQFVLFRKHLDRQRAEDGNGSG